MPNRIIKESVCTSDDIDKLSWFEEVFFCRLLVTVDDYGRYDARPAILKSALFPLKDSVTLEQVEEALRTLVSIGMVAVYKVEGKPILCLPAWEKHQRIRQSKAKYPGPEESDPEEENDEENEDSRQPAATRGNSRQLAATCGNSRQLAATRGDLRQLAARAREESESESQSESESEVVTDGGGAREARAEVSEELKALIELYQQNISFQPSMKEYTTLKEWLADGYALDLIEAAIAEAVANNAKNARYIDAILKNAKQDGVTTGAQLRARSEQYRARSKTRRTAQSRAAPPRQLERDYSDEEINALYVQLSPEELAGSKEDDP